MAATRDRALRAAVDLVGDEGVRALTHARVDARAGLPRGSTSNWFRTRDALVCGVVESIAIAERAELGAAAPLPASPAEFVAAMTAGIEVQTTVHAARTRARYALFLEAAGDTALVAPLREQRVAFDRWVRAALEACGASDPDVATRAFMAFAEGVVLHRLTVDRDAAVRPLVDRALRGILAA